MCGMKNVLVLTFSLISALGFSQTKKSVQKKTPIKKNVTKAEMPVVNDSVAVLIPFKSEGKFGFRNQKGKVVIKPQFSNVGFFTEDCNLLNSSNEKVRKFGGKKFASVRLEGVDFRIDQQGKKVYQFKDADLGKCDNGFKKQYFHGYMKNGFYGIIEDAKFENPEDYRQYRIYPQYHYVHVLEGDDLRNPMIIASVNDRFGIIDVNNKVILPFDYLGIKPNYSWKLARLFEVTQDGKNYFYVDEKGRKY